MHSALDGNGKVVTARAYDEIINGLRMFCIDKTCGAPLIHVPESEEVVAHFRTTGREPSIHHNDCGFAKKLTFKETVAKVSEYQISLREQGIREFVVKLNLKSIDPDYLLLGVYLVLLTPCIDYVIVFTALGGGNEKLILMSTPILFITQMLLLPLYLWLFMGEDVAGIVEPVPFLEAFLGLIVIPLGIAIGVQLLVRKAPVGKKILELSAWLPVPFMALTLFVIVASQIGKLSAHMNLIIIVIPIYVAFMIIMPVISRFIAKWFKIDTESGRALIFSGSTRNSLVVLPLALALPDELSTLVAAIIVTQTIVELAGELIYIRLVPSLLLRKETT